MTALRTQSSLSAPKRRLVRLLQFTNFGAIEIVVRDGEPTFDPPPRVVRNIKLGAESGPRPELALAEFALRGPVLQLFDELGRIKNGTVASIHVQHGMPCRLIVEEPV